MNPIKSKHIVFGLAAAFILFLFNSLGDEDYSYGQTRNQAQFQSPMQYQSSYRSLESEPTLPFSSTRYPNPSNLSRHEILQTKVKGYREETYWGEQSSTAEKVKHFCDDEFDRFIDEVELNDADVYWGAEY
jgi:hypothetical protein